MGPGYKEGRAWIRGREGPGYKEGRGPDMKKRGDLNETAGRQRWHGFKLWV